MNVTRTAGGSLPYSRAFISIELVVSGTARPEDRDPVVLPRPEIHPLTTAVSMSYSVLSMLSVSTVRRGNRGSEPDRTAAPR